MKTYYFLSAIAISFVIIFCLSCGSDKVVAPTLAKIEFPTTTFNINPLKDTVVFGSQGTRIFIASKIFQFSDGAVVQDKIEIKLKEFYKKSDIILADLSTSSNSKLLETGGMLHIEASSNGKRVELRPSEKLIVHFPKRKDNYADMKLFYPDKNSTDSSVTNWEVDNSKLVKKTLKLGSFGWWYPSHDDSTSYDFIPKNYVDTGYYWNPIDFHVKSYKFSENTHREIETTLNTNSYPKFVNWNDYGVQCEMKISTNGDIIDPVVNTEVSDKAKKEIISFLNNLPQLEPGRNKHGEIIERRGLIFIQAGDIIPIYETNEKYISSFDAKYSKYENTPIKNIDDAELNYYILSVSKLGWINCDRFIDKEETIDFIVQAPVTPSNNLKMVFKDFNGVLKPSIKDGKYVFSKVPKGEQVTIVSIKNEIGKLSASFENITLKETPLTDLTYNEITLSELKKKLEAM